MTGTFRWKEEDTHWRWVDSLKLPWALPKKTLCTDKEFAHDAQSSQRLPVDFGGALEPSGQLTGQDKHSHEQNPQLKFLGNDVF